jgi:hypothetical protein
VTGSVPDYSGLSWDVPDMGKLWEYCVRPYLMSWGMELGYMFTPVSARIRDGIWGSPDGVFYASTTQEGGSPDDAIVEVKLKFSHYDPDPPSNRRWMSQVKAYCKVLGVRDVYMLVGQVASKPPLAKCTRYHYTFEQEEIDSVWEGLLSAREYAKANNILPPIPHA